MLHSEAKTFSHRAAALTSARHRQIALENSSALTKVQRGAPLFERVLATLRDFCEFSDSFFRPAGCVPRIREYPPVTHSHPHDPDIHRNSAPVRTETRPQRTKLLWSQLRALYLPSANDGEGTRRMDHAPRPQWHELAKDWRVWAMVFLCLVVTTGAWLLGYD